MEDVPYGNLFCFWFGNNHTEWDFHSGTVIPMTCSNIVVFNTVHNWGFLLGEVGGGGGYSFYNIL